MKFLVTPFLFILVFVLFVNPFTKVCAQNKKKPEVTFVSNDLTPGFGTLVPEVFLGRQVAASVSLGLSSEINLSNHFRLYGSIRHSVGEIENSMNDIGDQHTDAGDIGFTYYFIATPVKAKIKIPLSATYGGKRDGRDLYYVHYAIVHDKKMLKCGLRGGALGYAGSKSLDNISNAIYYIDSKTGEKKEPYSIRSRTIGAFAGLEVSLAHNVKVLWNGSERIGRAAHIFFADVVYGVNINYWDIGRDPQILYNTDETIRNMGFRAGYIYHGDPKYNFNLYLKGEFGNLPGVRATVGDCFYMLFSLGKDLSLKNKAN